jgi:isopenicillin N synthase-like dioxygenase
MERVLSNSRCVKARLLHYYPTSQVGSDSPKKTEKEEAVTEASFSSWCGWHNDHSSLTGLTAALFVDENGDVIPNADPTSGLYIRTRKSDLVKVAIPQDHIAFQIGETQQIHSGGILQATPHAVRGTKIPGVSRETFAVFLGPEDGEIMNIPPNACPDKYVAVHPC